MKTEIYLSKGKGGLFINLNNVNRNNAIRIDDDVFDAIEYLLAKIETSEHKIKELKDDIEKIRHITYATFGEGWTYEKATIEQKKIADIDKIIYPKYYNSENENKQ